ncbi:hypothetical protein QBC46DRAFT_296101, partial [Diplogelasinospora grovesii]
MTAMETANPHHHHHGHQQPYPPIPASPTLTNPDMILPDYERSTSPDPDLNGDRDHSPLMMWKNAHAAATGSDVHTMFAVVATPVGSQRLDPYGPTGPITPTTPIIYGNGTMLSDIGEVTEVESTPGKPSPSRFKVATRRTESPTRGSGSDAALRSSPTMGVASTIKKKSKQSLAAHRERRSSIGSNSTITIEDQAALFADFDDAASVGDSVFQGDDEESMASSYVEGTPGVEPTARLGIPNTDNMDRLSTYSTTSLSRRAEEILANAKKRLTTMEGNLTRARSSLQVGIPSYTSDGSTPSPPFQRASTAIYTQENGLPSPSYSPGHSRISSDVATRNGPPHRVSTQRSQSALGAAGGYRQPLVLSKSVDQIRTSPDSEHGRPTYKITTPRDTGLQPLSEDAIAEAVEDPDRSSQGARLDQFLSPTFGTSGSENGDGGVRRSTSAVQMRDIKDQMKDLKGKISSLREQARVDSMKRRSLQSLRTPSPFTHAQIDQWYAEPQSNRSSEIMSGNELTGKDPWNGEESSIDGGPRGKPVEPPLEPAIDPKESSAEEEDSIYSEVENGTRLRPAVSQSPAVGQSPERKPLPDSPADMEKTTEVERDDDDISDMHTENGDDDNDGEEGPPGEFQDVDDIDYESESGESLYHDTLQHPISHEDREDAFDYEHFFLHSAMGTMSQHRLKRQGSTDSFTSEDSTETTRGPVLERQLDGADGDDRISSKSRRNSIASISTIETFATADEGRRSRKSLWSNLEPDTTDAAMEEYPDQVMASPGKTRPESIEIVTNRASFGHIKSTSTSTTKDSDGSIESIPEEGAENQNFGSQNFQPSHRISVIRRPMSSSATASLHRPSVSSFESTGTNRSFPLVNKPKRANSTGILTPNSSPDHELKSISDTLMNETASICEQQHLGNDGINGLDMPRAPGGLANNPSAAQSMHTLLREDKYLVERLVASLGRCVLGLTESGRASAESRMYRRRIDAARKILEGLEGV